MTRYVEGNIAGQGHVKLTIDHGRVSSVTPSAQPEQSDLYCSPGLTDVQVNGFQGIDFSGVDLDVESMNCAAKALAATGVTTFCPTLITNSIQQLAKNFRILERARASNSLVARMVPGYHLEGPYISSGPSRGAHDSRWIRTPDIDEFRGLQEAAGGHIRILTVAPELPGALDLIAEATRDGVRVAIGHTDACADEIHAAAEAGAALSTHLGNGCPQTIHRHQNPLWPQLADDRLSASIICDYFHLPADLVRTIYRVKGSGRCLLVSDAIHVTGLPPGRYFLVTTPIELLPNGKVATAEGHYLAGSALTMDRAVVNFMALAAIPLAEALEAATSAPAHFLGSPAVCSALEPGQPANLILFRAGATRLEIERCMVAGEDVEFL